MSTNLVEKDKYTLTRFYGGEDKGTSLQLTIESEAGIGSHSIGVGCLSFTKEELDEFIADLMTAYKEL